LVTEDEDLRLALSGNTVRRDPQQGPDDEVAEGKEHRRRIQTRSPDAER
jgi:hypothetical protein